MTKRERFQHFLENKPVDRAPVAFFHHFCRFEDFGKGVDADAILEQNIEGPKDIAGPWRLLTRTWPRS